MSSPASQQEESGKQGRTAGRGEREVRRRRKRSVPVDFPWGDGSLERLHADGERRHSTNGGNASTGRTRVTHPLGCRQVSQVGQVKGPPEIPPGTCRNGRGRNDLAFGERPSSRDTRRSGEGSDQLGRSQEVRTGRNYEGGARGEDGTAGGRAGRETGDNRTAEGNEGQGWERNRGQQNGRGERRAGLEEKQGAQEVRTERGGGAKGTGGKR
uniref:Uncharacterized protein n=1 Tax=Chromera velia CCMP2878 TaxID=1169474 RepID=A0A0G4FT43_9ALVE|eukprot:Cvel_18606.t1-p1 / transcript=Cvel_18606.t1 / gene=Cvel_18606 / organism=Chromera_velia_CCMP2878 / gene_product=hypothetical protein / transcript_product=hypothetical protein / location=Cvel_scaffold1552:28816-29993(-) / protein_length=211 / sequence_SO=supercontig / SO=protein_coding / is_pseudo=false